jgi:pyruvate/2-oxoglutarate dehydrogenase complex dihydrolipoamide acyltransferase (E2) component
MIKDFRLPDLGEGLTESEIVGRKVGGGRSCITNIGVFGIDAGTQILNPGEAAILALGAVRKMPWEYQDEVALRQVMTLSLSFDHRLVDGEQGSRFLQDLGTILAEGIRPGALCGELSTSGPQFSACPRQSAPGPPCPLALACTWQELSPPSQWHPQ